MGGIAHGELDNGQEGVHTRQTDESTRQMETVYADMQPCSLGMVFLIAIRGTATEIACMFRTRVVLLSVL